MDTRYTNREKFLDGLSNRKFVEMIIKHTKFCDKCLAKKKCFEEKDLSEDYIYVISEWLGEYSDD